MPELVLDRASDPAEIELRNVEKKYGNHAALSGVNLKVRAGEAVAIVGPSGGGKSTLLRCINLLEKVSSGEVYFRGTRIANGSTVDTDADALRTKIGLVFQNFNLWPNKTVMANLIEAPTQVLGITKTAAIDTAREWLERMRILDQANKYPSQLSGGEQQRAAIARALAMNPHVLLLDEITSALDIESVAEILQILDSLRDGKRTFLFVTHHLQFAERHTDRTAILIGGKIVECGPSAEILRNPKEEATRRFLGLFQEWW
ncbi:MAG: amino acid ABC transporter ATP-binding protein [Acidobacteria bacterium]|nr:amino acid ABC transporter ATP-binding protein [Acidobacteriota bacterium]